jgi:DNA (cytosine-5)-methyltransferase 1
MTPKLFSFFSGAGFLDLGFEREGFNVVFVNEYLPEFLSAYKHSRKVLKIEPPEYGYHAGSITDFSDNSALGSKLGGLVRASM